jgi:hypothetical protein
MLADPAAHIQKIRQLHDSGAWIVNIQSGQPHQFGVLEFYAGEVLPSFE